MKKWLLAMSALLLTVGLLTGCGSKDKDSDAVKSVTGESKDKDKDEDEVVVDEPDEPDEPEEVINEDEDKDKDEEKDKDKDKAKDEDKKDKDKSSGDNLLAGIDKEIIENIEVVSHIDLDETLEFGPMILDITAAEVSEVTVEKDFVPMFDGEEEFSVVSIEMRAENTSDEDVRFYPDEAT